LAVSFASKIEIPARMAWREWPAMARRRFSLRIEQPEAREMRVEQVEHPRSAPGLSRESGALQSLDGLLQLAPGLGNLLVGGLLGVEVDARASAAVGSRSMIGGASPELHDNADEGSGESEGSGAGIENEIGQDLGEQAEGPLDMGFVLRSRGRRADAEGVAESEVDFGGVIGGTVVEQQRERRLARGDDAVLEGLDDGGGVLLGAHAGAGEGARVRVDIKLEVEGEALSVDDDGHLHAVADPLGAREEGAEGAAQCAFVGGSALAVRGAPQTVDV
jgi:hypothetical protein